MNLNVDEKYKLVIVGFLSIICTIATIYSHIVLKADILFIHLYYIPLIMCIFWWEKKAIILFLFFSLVTIITQYPEFTFIYDDIVKIIILFAVSLLTLYLVKEIKDKQNINITDENSYYQTLLNSTLDSIVFLDEKYRIIQNNMNFEVLTGQSKEKLIGQNIFNLNSFNPKNKDKFYDKLNHIIENKTIEPYETKIKDSDNKIHWVICYGTAIYRDDEFKGVMIILEDITQMKDVENQLRISLNEKEMMLKEVHHRVKNNLMIISSLLSIQSTYVTDEKILQVLTESENRANTMALIHEKLYQSDLSHLELGDYLISLSKEIFDTYNSTSNIDLKINVDEVYVDVDTAIPIGLIVNELITNSIKYAFPNGENGTINISLKNFEDNTVLTIGDNGIGIPNNIKIEKTNSLGMELLNNLTKQIDAKLTLLPQKGTNFKIEFEK